MSKKKNMAEEKNGAEEELAEAETTAENQEEQKEEIREVGQSELPRIIEAVLFASDEPLNLQRLKDILPRKPDIRKIRAAIDDINQRFSAEHHPFEVVEVAGGYQFRTVPYYHPWVRQLFKDRVNRRLSRSALETLAVIAYKQPVTKAEIESIRGVVADGAMKTLLERRLITITGRSEKPGRPLLYGTTKDFLKYFGLNHLDDLPKIEEFEAMARQQQEETMDEASEVILGDEKIEEMEEAQKVEADENQETPMEDEFIEEIEEAQHLEAEEGKELDNEEHRGIKK